MKKLSELVNTNLDIVINSLEDDSRIKKDNYLFFCIKGLTTDGHEYAKKAVENGAVAIVASDIIDVSVPVIYVEDTSKAMCDALDKFYDNVLDNLSLIGVTGTDGKTTTSTVIYQIINYINKDSNHCGLIGSNGMECPGFRRDNQLTTPFPKELFETLNDFKNRNCKYVSMEVSSERLLTGRLDSLQYDFAILTNLTREHLNSHHTMENYIQCKQKLFKSVKNDGFSIINIDDEYENDFISVSTGKVITFGLSSKADIYATDIEIEDTTSSFMLNGKYGTYRVNSSLTGKYNVYNTLAAIIVTRELGFAMEKIIAAINNISTVSGRNQHLNFGQDFEVIVDYAHTTNALKNLIEYAKTVAKGRVITLTGSAGGKDQGKRKEMGKIVTDLSDYAIFTEDDPRFEDPEAIINDLLENVNKSNYEIIVDRGQAIKRAIDIAKTGDIVLICGRGQDDYIPKNGIMIEFNDIKFASEYLKTKNGYLS